ncbi:MAG TPA: pitrilysin family protein [Kofleriaceae bacterium]|nr:pitrilysin family protein [Kofleriaceae bacterium]
MKSFSMFAAVVLSACCARPAVVQEPIAEETPKPRPQPQPQPQPVQQPVQQQGEQPAPWPALAVPPVVAMPWEQPGVPWEKVPEPWPEAAFSPPRPVTFALADGVKVYLVENHRLPLVSVRVLHAAAGTREDGAQTGLAAMTADVLDEATPTRSAVELPEELERLGARLAIATGVDGAVLSLDTLAETLEPALGIAADMVIRPRLDPADFERIKAERVADLALRPDEPRAIAAIVFEQLVFGTHPYASPGGGWSETVGAFTLDDVKTFHATHYAPKVTAIVVAGDVTRAQLEPMLARTWGTWKATAKVAPAPAKPKAARPVLAFVDRPGAPQSVITLGRLGPDAADKRRAELDVINTAVGGSFAARLNARLREELGYTYGVFSSVWRGQRAGAWSVSSSIRTDVTGAGIREILDILGKTAGAPLPADELAKSKSLIVRGLPQDFETNTAIAAAYASLISDNRPLTSYADLPRQIAKVTASGAKNAATAQWKDLSIVVVGDWAVIGKELEALGLPIVRYSPDGKRL